MPLRKVCSPVTNLADHGLFTFAYISMQYSFTMWSCCLPPNATPFFSCFFNCHARCRHSISYPFLSDRNTQCAYSCIAVRSFDSLVAWWHACTALPVFPLFPQPRPCASVITHIHTQSFLASCTHTFIAFLL